MIGKLLVLVLALVALLQTAVEADLDFDRLPSKPDDLKKYGLKCMPGRTVIRVEKPKEKKKNSSDEEARRSHMNYETKDELCKICVCSVEGKDEYCSQRPARNVNECIRMSILNKYIQSNAPFSHERSLSYRIRRDFIWHRDEIPYEAKATCKRGTSYYSNSVTANNTDIDLASDIDSLVDYSNKNVCYYCICSTDGNHAGCISRDPWFCEYYRFIRDPPSQTLKYHELFKQDRPVYFRQLSYRLRRTMDDGMDAFVEFGGDTLCCNHPDGHRRTMHEQVRNKIRLMRRKVPRENIMGGSPQGDYVDFIVNNDLGDENNTCIPFVSEYSDCSEVNKCTGCNKCSCTAEGEWSCETVLECPSEEDALTEAGVSNAIDTLYSKIENKERKSRNLVPPPPKPEEEFLASPTQYDARFKDFETFFSREKRSVNSQTGESNDDGNHTVKFYHTVDEINEDTLKGSNSTGTITAQKVEINRIPKILRRTNMYDNFNKSDFNALHIEYNQPQEYDHHISENKIESHHGDKIEYNVEKLNKIIGNFSSASKDTILSKIVVNELKGGSEIIGNKDVPPMSNITFTPENDTLTAMAFIAGNLLNKLWNMEMEHADFSTETEVLKHEKINDLLDLFKEPLSMRQENFIKNALEKLSDTLSKNRNVKNVSLCETVTDGDISSQEEILKSVTTTIKCIKEETTSKKSIDDNLNVPTEAISKLNNVLDLIKKFEHVQNSLNELRVKTLTKPTKIIEKLPPKVTLTAPENSSLKLFGNLLEKITKLLIPNKKSKKVLGKFESLNQLKDGKRVKTFVEDKYGINLPEKSISAKDKLILDYLNHIENNPNCLLKKNLQNIKPKPSMNVEGNILYNLSEFFKVKSFIDLVQLVKPDIISKTETTTEQEVTTILPKTFAKIKKIDSLQEQKNLNETKEKLKKHLKALIDDMIELQSVRGVNKETTKMNVVDALPCIYNILKADTTLNNDDGEKKKDKIRLDKIKNVLDSIKLEISSNNPLVMTRRSNFITEKSQSAKNWERVIKNINAMQTNTRRSFKEKPVKTYPELKNIMDRVEVMANSYKNFAMLSVVPPEKQLMLLKTLEADTRQEQKALEALTNSMAVIAELPLEKQSEIKEFIDNAANNINLSAKVLSNIDKSKHKNDNQNDNPLVEVFNIDQNKRQINELDTQNISEILDGYKNSNNVRLTRDQIVKQLIQKRIEYYLKSYEEAGLNTSDDVNYNIGKRILFLMESGNYNVAKELFKIFVAKRKEENVRSKKRGTSFKGTSTMNEQRTKGRLLHALKEPLIRFNEPVRDTQNQEHLFKQLLNFKNLS